MEGPHGEGVHDHPVDAGRLLIAAGIGITPALSVLRTAAQSDDSRRLLLVYGSRSWTEVTFREELADLERTHPQPQDGPRAFSSRDNVGPDSADGSARASYTT